MHAEGSIDAEGRKLERVSGLLYFRRPGAPGRVSRPTAIRYHHLPPSCNTFLHEAPVGIEPTNGRFAVSCLTTWLRRRSVRREEPSPRTTRAQVEGRTLNFPESRIPLPHPASGRNSASRIPH